MRQTADQHRETAGQLANEHVRHSGFEERQHRQWLREEARTLRQAANDLERFITEDVLESVQVITCTLVGASQSHIRHLSFETVFIDEAAQAMEPACWIPIAKGQRIVLAGDHHQLPPTVKSEKAAREGLRETLFEKCIQRPPPITHTSPTDISYRPFTTLNRRRLKTKPSTTTTSTTTDQLQIKR